MMAAATPVEIAEELRGRLRERESEWRKANSEFPGDVPVPEESKRRDVLWRALERKLAKAEAECC